ncbi:S-layer homology domain-containing protein [Phormidium sp. CLA17]|uniref:S-layer homology domain-containing protein n=1 Tax=Leptolyngbya sp. Cla-17 TaxID=2803751 RepID=UPI0014927F64|nr:S-layer homology domain-containing protein [Leptolyngbya sp. Cla-17]MBM0743279.1 S-layer homology domain-containing protein [Leptolyngbya sp. Cla-17]
MVQAAPAATLYIDSAKGNDAAAGTQAAPFKTISRALKQAKLGDRIQLAPGTYSATSGEVFPLAIPAGVTVIGNEATKGAGIAINGSGSFASKTFAGQNITLRMETNAQLRGVSVTNPATRGTGVWIESTNPVIINCTFINCKREGIFATGSASPAVYDNVATRNDANGFSIVRNAKGEWRRNVCQNTGFGFSIGDQAAPLLAENRVFENRSGMVLGQECRPVLRSNVVERNTSEGLTIIDRAFPDLGKGQDPGGNIFRDNTEFDINNATATKIVSVGNQVNPTKVKGLLELLANEVPNPGPLPTPTPVPPPNPGELTDIQTHWAAGFIRGLIGKGYISGFPDGTFKPQAAITRAQYAAIIAKAFNLPAKQSATPFVDVAQSFWAFPFIQKANQMGFISGFPDGSFRPDQNLTRVQAIVSLIGGLGLTGGMLDVLSFYVDRVQIPGYATEKVATATQRQIVVNYPTVRQLEPMRDVTRGEIAALVYQALVALNQAPATSSPYIVTPNVTAAAFIDIAGHWATDFISSLAKQNLIGGFADGSFKPDIAINRAQYAALLVKAFNPSPKRDAIAFSDIPATFWAKPFIDQAYRAGFISGFPDGSFKPDQNMPRFQLLASLVSGLGLSGGDATLLAAYDDRASIPQYAQNQVATATQQKLVVNFPTLRQLNPVRDTTRAEVAAFVYQALVQSGRSPAIASPYIVSV